MGTSFEKLNAGWEPEPNAPDPKPREHGTTLVLSFLLNFHIYPEIHADDVGILTFTDCWRYRLGSTNSDGWYMGQCRFSALAPEWGHLYEVGGNLLLEQLPDRWHQLGTRQPGQRHYLLYFRDSTFECDAANWSFRVAKDAAKEWGHDF